jgi:large subunit ribosomal protein L29
VKVDVKMKAKERETLKNLSVEELAEQLGECQQKYFDLLFKKSSGALGNPLEIRLLRRKIAAIKTFVNEKKRQK